MKCSYCEWREATGPHVRGGRWSMCMHMAAGADISVECFARNLYNQETLAVISYLDRGGRI